MTFWFRIAFTWWLGHFISCYLKVHFNLIKYTCGSKSQTLCMRYLFQSTGRPISYRNGWSFRVYMTPLRDFVPEWNSHPGRRTGVNSCRGDSRRHNILWWYHVNKYIKPWEGTGVNSLWGATLPVVRYSTANITNLRWSFSIVYLGREQFHNNLWNSEKLPTYPIHQAFFP